MRKSNFGGGDRNQDFDLDILDFVLLALQMVMCLGQVDMRVWSSGNQSGIWMRIQTQCEVTRP